MKQQLLKNWNFRRILFISMGGLMIRQSILEQQWISAILGSSLIVMALLNIGLARGCCGNSCSYTPNQKN